MSVRDSARRDGNAVGQAEAQDLFRQLMPNRYRETSRAELELGEYAPEALGARQVWCSCHHLKRPAADELLGGQDHGLFSDPDHHRAAPAEQIPQVPADKDWPHPAGRMDVHSELMPGASHPDAGLFSSVNQREQQPYRKLAG
jgi:hypothetical protein